MGGNSSTHGGLAIIFENSSYYAGQEVCGVINISVTEVSGQGTLSLRFKGIEITKWTTGGGKNKSYHEGKNKICDVTFPIFQFNEGLQVGGYSIPFSFKLPDNVPSSLSFDEGNIHAHITYKFFATFIGINKELIKGKQVIQIRHPIYASHINLAQKNKALLKTWCCVNMGTCEIDVSYPQDTYTPTDHAKFFVIIDNSQSKLSIDGVTCNLTFNLGIRSNYNVHSVIKRTVIRKSFPISIAPGTCGKSNPIEIVLDLSEARKTLEDMFTTKGHLIENVYTLEIEAQTDGLFMCFGDYAKVISLINIIPNENLVAEPPSVPSDWAPTLLEPVKLAYCSGNDIHLDDQHRVDN